MRGCIRRNLFRLPIQLCRRGLFRIAVHLHHGPDRRDLFVLRLRSGGQFRRRQVLLHEYYWPVLHRRRRGFRRQRRALQCAAHRDFDQAYSSLKLAYSAGTYERYQAFYTGITGQSFTGEEVDVSAANQFEKVVSSGMTSTPYSSVEQDYSGGALAFRRLTVTGYLRYRSRRVLTNY